MKIPKLMRRTTAASDKKTETEKTFVYNMTVCIFSIVLCLISLSAVTWAWYTADVSSQENIIHSAAYQPNVGIYCVEEVVTLASDATEATTVEARVAQASAVGELTYTLTKGKRYEVTIYASSDVKTGYYQITLGDQTYYTEQIAIGRTLSFALSVDQDTEITMLPLWGVNTKQVSLLGDREYHVLAGELREGQGALTDNDPTKQDPSSDEPTEPVEPTEPIGPTDAPDSIEGTDNGTEGSTAGTDDSTDVGNTDVTVETIDPIA